MKRNLLLIVMLIIVMLPYTLTTALAQGTSLVNIDGAIDDAWSTAETFNLGVVNSGAGISSPDDFSGNVKLLWDANNIYVLVQVKDDSLNTTNGQPWEVDHYSLYFDLSNLKTSEYVEDKVDPKDSVQFYFEKIWGKEAETWSAGRGSDVVLTNSVHFVEVINNGSGYLCEMVLPLNEQLGVTLTEGSVIGFDAKIGDNDGEAAKLDGKLSWNQVKDESWKNPAYLGEVKLGADGTFSKVISMPTIDGVADYTWLKAPTFNLEVVNTGTGIENANDFSGNVKLMWDENNIYALLQVKDDSLNTTNGNPWEVDHYSLYFDLSNLKTFEYVEDKVNPKDSVQFYFEKMWGAEVAEWSAGRGGDVVLTNGVHFIEVINNGSGYICEMVLPLNEQLGVSLTEGSIIGFDAKIGDNDGEAAKLDGKLSWNQVKDESWKNPSFTGNIKLENNGTFSPVVTLPKIDGIVDVVWTSAYTFALKVENENAGIENANDFSGTVKLMWDAKNIYALLEVKDDILNTTNGQAWEVDHYTLYFDLFNLKTNEYVSDKVDPKDSVQYNFEKIWGAETDLWFAGQGKDLALAKGKNYVEVINEGIGYVCEMKIPLADSLSFIPAIGSVFGFDAKIGDNDGEADKLDGKLSWNQIKDESWKNPSYMGAAKFEANGKVSAVKVASKDASIQSITIDGIALEGFSPKTYSYTIVLPEGAVVPVVEAIAANSAASMTISEATVVPGETSIEVVAEDGLTIATYVLNFVVETGINRYNTEVKMYPNPFNNTLTITSEEGNGKVHIANFAGQVVLSETLKFGTQLIDTSNLPNGIYFIRITNLDKDIHSVKFIKK